MGAYDVQAGHPFVHRELILARIVVQVVDQTRGELAHAWCGLGTDGVDNCLGEVWIEFVFFRGGDGGSVGGGHCSDGGWVSGLELSAQCKLSASLDSNLSSQQRKFHAA